jgi:putative transposase
MARLPRIAAPDLPHHVMQIGNNRQPIFIDDQDRQSWRDHLRESALNAHVEIHAYVQLDNHAHLLATPRGGADALGRMMQSLGRRYVATFNRRHGRSGTLWEGRYRAAVVDPESALLCCMRYIESHPQRSGIIGDAAQYAWSSLAHHLGRRRDPLITEPAAWWTLGNTPFDREAAYRRLLDEGVTPAEAKAISVATRRGWPIGSEQAKQRLALALGRHVTPRPRGRPRRSVTTEATTAPALVKT